MNEPSWEKCVKADTEGRYTRLPSESFKCLQEESYAKMKYGATAEQDDRRHG